MRITKVETPEVVSRQLEWFKATKSSIAPLPVLGGYEYSYVPGTNADDVLSVYYYLENRVWTLPALESDRGDYASYLYGLCRKTNVCPEPMCAILRWSCTSDKLVHGDATLENFLQTAEGIVPIDPGLSRGFNHPYNDIGKLLQSCLTHWDVIRHGASIKPYPETSCGVPMDRVIPIDRVSVASLMSHWVRILKNAGRHPGRVGEYGYKVIGALQEALKGEVDGLAIYNESRELVSSLLKAAAEGG